MMMGSMSCVPVDWQRTDSTWPGTAEAHINSLAATLATAYRIVRPVLFRLDPEVSHRLIFRSLLPVQRYLERTVALSTSRENTLSQRVCDLTFPSPIGLAAGFDKNAELPHVWSALGFGFAELGTITAHAQPGNPRPRLFRLTQDAALINRLGFNNAGAGAVTAQLQQRFRDRRPAMPYGINIGKSRVTALEDAPQDYLTSFRAAFPLADYIAINVSSPNTPGLRDLQSAAQLQPLLDALRHENQALAAADESAPRPLFLKIAPDIQTADLRALVDVARACGISGFIATNTTTGRTGLSSATSLAAEAGGLSGRPLRARSTAVIRELYQLSGGRLPIIGVGGIFSAADAYAKVRAGATLIQVYTGFVYEGPLLAVSLREGLHALLARDGHQHLGDAVGRDAAVAAA
jgi:dihydroorotate dehydrogenase